MLILDQNKSTEIQKRQGKIKGYTVTIWWSAVTNQQPLAIMESEGEILFADKGCLR